MRVKRVSHGGEHWIPRKPDANDRQEVVEINLKLGARNKRNKKRRNDGRTRKPGTQLQSTELIKPTETKESDIETRHPNKLDRNTIYSNQYKPFLHLFWIGLLL